MKYYLSILLVLLCIGANAQKFYHVISNETFDSLNTNMYYGKLFLKNGTQLYGWVKRTTTDEIIKFKENKEDTYKIYTAFKVVGFYLINAELDTAWFVFKRVRSENEEYRALRILVDGGPSGLHLLRYAWLSSYVSSLNKWKWFNPDVYQINWSYFLWNAKNKELTELVFYSKHLKRNIEDNELALEYYKKHRRKLKYGNYTSLKNLIRIYNETSF